MTAGVARTGLSRNLPLAFIAVVVGPFLTVVNPGLFWDDWVWIYQDPSENIQIGRELGIWWGGYLTNAINSLSEPVFTLRIVSLVSWAIAAICASWSLSRLRLIGRWEAWVLFLLMAAAPIPMVRFLNSVAMYNVYIAAFWIGAAILVADRSSPWRRWASLPFFIFSFYLSSLLLMYGGVLLLLLLDAAQDDAFHSHAFAWRPGMKLAWSGVPRFKLLLRAQQDTGLRFLRRNWFFVLLPVVFFLATTLLRARSPFYSGYNQVRPVGAVLGLFNAVTDFPYLVVGYVAVPLATVPRVAAVIFAFAILFLVRLLPDRTALPSWRRIAATGVIGLFTLQLGILPYFVVGKSPILDDFYEARHILPAVPGLLLIEIAILQSLTRIGARWWAWMAIVLRDTGVAVLLSSSILFSVMSGLSLLKDWVGNEAIEAFLKTNTTMLGPFRTIIFDDQTFGMRTGNRFIWNYEYTGELIRAFGSKRYLGISLAEYRDWPKNVLLITDDAYRKRYNLESYDFYRPHLVVKIRNGDATIDASDLLAIAMDYWRARSPDLSRFVEFSVAQEYIESPRQMALMERLLHALDDYKREHGTYPSSLRGLSVHPGGNDAVPLTVLGTPSPQSDVCRGAGLFFGPSCGPGSESADQAPALPLTSVDAVFHAKRPGSPSPSATKPVVAQTWFDAIAPTYVPREILDPACLPKFCGLLYISDGKDLKLVFQQPLDMPYARQAYGSNIDPTRVAYGFWTPAAARW